MSFNNYGAIAEELAAEFDLPKVVAAKILPHIIRGMLAEIKAFNTPVKLAGFGTFSNKITKPRNGRNPKTGESISIPAKATIRFSPSPMVVVADRSTD